MLQETNNLFGKSYSVNTDLPSPPTVSEKQHKRFGKKLYILIAAIAAISIIAVALFIPPGAASIPLNVNYNVGEKMVYDTSASVSFGFGNSALSNLLSSLPSNTTLQGTQTIEVVGFDGESYTLNHTITMAANGVQTSTSSLETQSKIGYSAYLMNMGDASQGIATGDVSGGSYLAQLLNKSEVKVGDSVNIPYPDNGSDIGVTGDLTLTFEGIQSMQVPAGTFKVFRVDLTNNNLQVDLNQLAQNFGSPTTINGTVNININCQMYVGYGTMRIVRTKMSMGYAVESSEASFSMGLGMDMTLTQDIQP